MELHCRLTTVGGLPVLQVSGEIDLATLPVLRDQLARAVGLHAGASLFVDLDGVTALDDSGLGMLLGAAARSRDAGGDVIVVCSTERLLHRFALTRLDRAISVRPNLHD